MLPPFLPCVTANPEHPPKLLAFGKTIEVRQAELKKLRGECRQLERSLGRRDEGRDWTPLFQLQLELARREEKLLPLVLEHEETDYIFRTRQHQAAQQRLADVEADRRKELGLAPDDTLTVIQKQSCTAWVKAYRASVGGPGQSRAGEIHEYAAHLRAEIPRLEKLIKEEKGRLAKQHQTPAPRRLTRTEIRRQNKERCADQQKRTAQERADKLLRQ